MKYFKSIAIIMVTIFFVSLLIKPANEPADAKSKKPLMTIGMVTDVQYCDCAPKHLYKMFWSHRYYQSSPTKLNKATDTFNKKNVNYVFNAGDTIDRDIKSYDKILPILNKVDKPHKTILGNHDFPNKSKKAVSKLNMPAPYYSFTKKGYRFIFLNTNDVSTYANKKGSIKYNQSKQLQNNLKAQGAINYEKFNGALSAEQLSWLQNELNTAKSKKQKVIIVGHHPVYPLTVNTLHNYQDVLAMIDQYPNVVAYFNGHAHLGEYQMRNGVHYVTFNGMVEDQNQNAYSILKLYKDKIKIDGYGKEPDRTLNIAK